MQTKSTFPRYTIAHSSAALVLGGRLPARPHWMVLEGGIPRVKLSDVDMSETLLLSVFVAILLAASVLTGGLGGENSASSVHVEPLSAGAFSGIMRAKDEFLQRLNSGRSRQVVAHTHYIAELILREGRASSKEGAYRLAQLIVQESLRAGYDPLFVASVIKAESTFNRHAVSNQGARGLMQLLPSTAHYISSKRSSEAVTLDGRLNLHDPATNIRLGLAYLQYLEDHFDGNLEHTLVAYNWGPANLKSALKNGARIPSQPRGYAKKIMSNLKQWRSDLNVRLALRHRDVLAVG